jgi:hypothetical protein
MKYKLVALSLIYKNIGSPELPMWRCIGANEYVVSRFDSLPEWVGVGKAITEFQHILEGNISQFTKEIYSGFEIYDNLGLTHNENFQLIQGGTIDFPAKDVTEIDVRDEMDGIKGM